MYAKNPTAQQLFSLPISSNTVSRYIGIVRDAQGKQKYQKLLMSEFKDYFGLE
jgi:hypothetical protein